MKVEVVPGYQLVDRTGVPWSSGVVDMDDGEAAEALRNGWASPVSEAKSKAKQSSPNKAQTASENKSK